GGALGLGLYAWDKTRLKLGIPILLSSLIFPLLLTGWTNFQPGPSSNFDFAKTTPPLLKSLLEKSAPSRMILDYKQLLYYPVQTQGQPRLIRYPQNAACALHFKNLGGYNPLTLARYNQFLT